MKFTDVLKALQNAWAFAWPPIVALAVMFVVADFVSSFSVKASIMDSLATVEEKTVWLKEVKAMLNEYGLAKVLTVFVGVLVVVVLYLIKHVGLAVAGAVPPYLVISKPGLLLRVLPEKEIIRLRRRYPEAKSFDEGYQWAEQEYAYLNSDVLGSPTPVGVVVGQLAKLAGLTAVWLELSGMMDPGMSVGILKTLLVLGISAVVWSATAIAMLRHEQALLRSRWFAMRKLMFSDSAALDSLEPSELELKTAKEAKEAAQGKRWWKVQFLSGSALEWVRQNLKNS